MHAYSEVGKERRTVVKDVSFWLPALLLWPLVSIWTAAEGAVPAIGLSGDGSYLVDASGDPVFMNGDTAWSLMVEPTDAEIETYLADRQAKGFNVVIAELVEHKFAAHAPANVAGDEPFGSAAFQGMNDAYFARVDRILNQAASHGITVLLAPAYVGYQCGDEGWCAELKAASLATMRSYGQFVGQRYKDFPNIIWMIGGDADPFPYNVDGKLEEMVAGIKDYDPDHLMTSHTGPETSAQEVWGARPWLNLNTVYTYSSSGTQAKTYTEYNRTGALPLFLLETAYENEHGSTPQSLRTQAYQAVLWGARLGQFFGNCPIWPFAAAPAAGYCASTNWIGQLSSAGSTTVAYIGNLMRSRRHWLMRPDHATVVMTAGYGSGATRAVTSRATDGSSVIAYIPTRRQVTIDLSSVSGTSARAWWWNPRTNTATSAGTFPTTGSQDFTPPDTNDWVLVLDDASLSLPMPGADSGGTVPMPPQNLRAD